MPSLQGSKVASLRCGSYAPRCTIASRGYAGGLSLISKESAIKKEFRLQACLRCCRTVRLRRRGSASVAGSGRGCCCRGGSSGPWGIAPAVHVIQRASVYKATLHLRFRLFKPQWIPGSRTKWSASCVHVMGFATTLFTVCLPTCHAQQGDLRLWSSVAGMCSHFRHCTLEVVLAQ